MLTTSSQTDDSSTSNATRVSIFEGGRPHARLDVARSSGEREYQHAVDVVQDRHGRRAVERMNSLGMAIDVSHSGDRTCMDTYEQSSRPVLITHAGARALWPTPRMKPDEVLRGCAETGGVIGIEAAPHTTLSDAHPLHSLESVMDHFSYCVDLMGIDHVAFGPDTLYGDHVALHKTFAASLGVHDAQNGPSYEEVPYVAGLENPTECFFNIVGWLVKNGYSDEDIKKVTGGNIMRVLGQIW